MAGSRSRGVQRGPPGRSGNRGQPQRGLELILRDEVMLEKGCALADRADREDGLSTDTPPWPADLLEAWPSFDELGPRPSIKEWWAGCPVCGREGLLRVRWVDQGSGRFDLRCASRCDPARIFGACEALRAGDAGQLGLGVAA